MSSAVLRITTSGGSELAQILGKIKATALKEQEDIVRGEKTSLRQMNRDHDEHVKAFEKSEKEKTKAALRELAEQKRAQKDAEKTTEKAQRDATRIADREAKERLRNEAQAAKESEKIAKGLLFYRMQTEREATREARMQEQQRLQDLRQSLRESVQATERAARDEARAIESARQAFRGAAGGIGRAAFGLASGLHGQIQDVRERRADTEHTLNEAFGQAGAGTETAAPLRAMVMQFAQQNRMSSAEIAAGLNAAQTEFSILGNSRSSQEDRTRNLQNSLQTALFARNTGQNVGEVMRVQGMLANAELTPAQQRQSLLALTGMAQRGAIELGSVTRTAMAPMQARIGQALAALGPGADAATRQHVTQQAVMQTMAEMEVGRGLGYTPRNMGNIMSQLGGALTSNVTQEKMFANIENATGLNAARRREIESQLFVTDSHGRHVLRGEYQSGLGLAQGLSQAFHGDSTAMQNVFAGGGQGNPQSLQANWRRVMGAFMGEGNENIRKMMEGAGTDFTEADVNRLGNLFSNEERSKLTGDKEAHDNALGDNTSAINKLSNAIEHFQQTNPIGSSVLKTGGDVLGAVGAGSSALGLLSKTRAGTAVGGRLAGAGSAIGGFLTGTGGALLGAGVAGLVAGDQWQRRFTDQHGYAAGNAESVFNPNTWRMIGHIIRDSIEGTTVTVSQHDAVHAATVASVPNPQRR